MNILDAYVLKLPGKQNVLDLFQGEWSTAMPDGSGLATQPGTAALFDSALIHHAGEMLGGFAGRRVLELGPLEGGHSYMLQQAGAADVVAIEANSRAFLKCLCIKEIFGLDRVHYHLGDFMQYLEAPGERFDVALASGVLYHMNEPLKLLDLVSRRTDRLVLWTHYYDEALVRGNAAIAPKFAQPQQAEYQGFQHTQVVQSYQAALDWNGFCGGAGETSVWLPRQVILDFLASRGFAHLHVHHEWTGHPNGPSFAVVASRTPLRDALYAAFAGLGRTDPTLAFELERADASRIDLAVSQRAGTDALPLFTAVQTPQRLWLLTGAQGQGWQDFDAVDQHSVAPTALLAPAGPTQLSIPRAIDGAPVSGIYFGRGGTLADVMAHQRHVHVAVPL